MGKNRRTFAQRKVGSGWILSSKRLFASAGISLGVSGLTAVLFYKSPWGMCSLPAIFFLTEKTLQKSERRRARKRLNLEFKDYMYSVSGLLEAGNSIERSFLTALEDVVQLYGEESVLVKKLCGMERRLSVQEPMEHILQDFAEESDSEDIENFVEIFCCAKRGGGDFIHIIATSVQRICDKIEVLEEIHTVMAEKALEQKVMCVVPLGILLFFKVTSPEFIGQLYGNALGVCIMTAALLLYGTAFFLGMKIVEVEV